MSGRIHEGAIRDQIARISGDNKTLLRNFSRELFNAIRQGLLDDGHVRLYQFGSFKLHWTRERKGRNPRTGESLIIAAHPRVVFTPAKALKDKTQDQQLDDATISATKANAEISSNIPPVQSTVTAAQSSTATSPTATDSNNQKTIIREPYLSKNIKHKNTDIKSSNQPPIKSIAAALIIAAFAFYLYQPAIETETTLTIDTSGKSNTNNINSLTTEVVDEKKQVAPAATQKTTETISLEPAILQYANEPEPVAPIEQATVNVIATNSESMVTENKPAAFFPEKSHHLVNGDSLWRLSKKNYINPFYWPHIYQANSKYIYNPNKLLIGRTITLPALYGHPDKLTDEDRRHIAEGYFLVYRYNKKHQRPFSYYALLGVKKFDPSVIEEHIYEIEENDWESLQLASN
ncbi:MAG: HU family DNA-binding protein [Gammaproteobacteria bacterium]|nr:HU family DNA-binding protein [Gammaproteobacteria bacterium]